MLKKNNKEMAIKKFNDNKVEYIFNIILNLSDKALDYIEKNIMFLK